MEAPDDKELIQAYTESLNLDVLAALFKKYDRVIFRACMQILKNAEDSEDACVDIFLELKDKLPKYQIDNFAAWLYRVVQNHCYKKLKKKGRLILEEIKNSDEKVEFEQTEDHIDEMINKLPAAIDTLSQEQKWCVVLFYLHGKSYKEIENLKGYSFKQIKSSIQHGKKNLKKKLATYVR